MPDTKSDSTPDQESSSATETADPKPEQSAAAPPASEGGSTETTPPRRQILIGSQRREKDDRNSTDDAEEKPAAPPTTSETPANIVDPATAPQSRPSTAATEGTAEAPKAVDASTASSTPNDNVSSQVVASVEPSQGDDATETSASAPDEISADKSAFPPPRLDRRLTPELEQEIAAALDGASLDDLMAAEQSSGADQLEPETRTQGRVVGVHREHVIVDLGVRNQGVLPIKQFPEAPEVGTVLDVVVQRFDLDDGLYTLTMPGASVHVGDWSQLAEGVIVEARITGHNKGGLECDVNHIRGFIPASQIDVYRVNDLEKFVGEKFSCVVTEAKPERKNLVLSRRALIEREREAAKKKLLEELAPGQVREGVVRKLMDFGAFVDLGGVDGLIHISQMSWQRVNHPKDVLQEGQRLDVKVLKIDPDTGKIGLGLRELLDDPWADVTTKFTPQSSHRGRVAKILQFGALVELDSGVSGLVHISELSHKHVKRVTEVVSEGQDVDVVVLSVDNEKRRIALSMKALTSPPELPEEEAEPEQPRRRLSDPSKLRGGTGGASGGEQFGLKW